MRISLSKHGSSIKARLSESLEIQCAGESKGPLMEALECSEEIEYDLSGLSELDTSGVQLLVLLKREASAQGRRCRLTHANDTVTEVLGLLGLSDLCDPLVIAN
jgi:ABC-type transporter Mla MlaB component